MLSELQEIVYGIGSAAVRKIDNATGMPPYLATVAGTRHYNCPADCRITNLIFVQAPTGRYRETQDITRYGECYWGARKMHTKAISQTEATEGVLSTVTFVDDPGTTTDKYYHDYYVKATPLTTEQVELTIPGHQHWLIREGVIRILRSESYGPSGVDIDMIERIARKIRNRLNHGSQPRAYQTAWRAEDLDY